MKIIGSRELKSRLGTVLRDVRERRQEYAITQHGKVVARLLPETPPVDRALSHAELWAEWDRLAKEVGERSNGMSAEEAVNAVRRRL